MAILRTIIIDSKEPISIVIVIIIIRWQAIIVKILTVKDTSSMLNIILLPRLFNLLFKVIFIILGLKLSKELLIIMG